jgi:allantoinase
MPGNRRPGMDQDFYTWSPLPFRKAFSWPEQARIGLCVLVSLDDRVIDPPADDEFFQQLPNAGREAAYPDLNGFTTAQYGLRNGIFRLMKVLDRYEIPTSVAIDAKVATDYPFLVEQCKGRGWEFLGHGLMSNYPLTNALSEEVEREYIRRSIAAVTQATGRRPLGWFGSDYQESSHTLNLLVENGVQYVLDWPNDEQPYGMQTANGPLLSLPVFLELDDAYALSHRRVTVWRWEQMVKDAFDVLYEDGSQTGKLLTLSLHPSIMGRAFRIRSLDIVLDYICSRGAVWKARAGQIAEWYRSQSLTAA